jgi:TatD DNase family protein
MAKLTDSHCHLDRLDLEPFEHSLERALGEAGEAGVEHMLCVCIDLEHFDDVIGIAREHAQVSCSVGVHPDATDVREPSADDLVALAARPEVVAVGETGLDYYRLRGDLEWQRERFRTHIRAARQAGKPLIVHTRCAREDTIRLMREEGADQVGGVMHCFAEDWDTAAAAIDLGFMISFSGIVTFRSADALREVARRVPEPSLLIETDAPYLAPVPHRGRSNHPAWVRHVAERLAEVRGEAFDHIAAVTTANFRRLFRAGS